MTVPKDSIENVIAVRELYLTNSQAVSRPILVCIGRPYQNAEFGEYLCEYQITGVGSEEVRRITGIDAVQALQCALVVLGADLTALNASIDNTLRWKGGEPGDVGFGAPS
ncbi:MAG: DUF6968 family protein [Pyrinomonadaceae bacterium]